MKYDQNDDPPNPVRCMSLSLALTYYFRLPTKEDNAQRKDQTTPSREELGELISRSIPNFVDIIQDELERFVNAENFVIPQGVAINQAVGSFFLEFSLDLFFVRFVNISLRLSSVLSLERLCVSSAHLVNPRRFPFKLSYKIFKVLSCLPNRFVNVYRQLIHSFVLDRNIVDQKISPLYLIVLFNVNNNINKVE